MRLLDLSSIALVLSCAGGRALAQQPHPEVAALEAKLLRARPLPLDRVRLTGGPLQEAQLRDLRTLLGLEPDRMLAFYRKEAGLEPKARGYGGWDGGGRNLTGHLAGHYLSAVSLMFAATGDPRLEERATTIVTELAEVQAAHGDGYLSALAGGRECWAAVSRGEIRSSGFDLNGLWAPWYTLHKTFGGLRDAYRYTGNGRALEVEIAFAAWAESVLEPLSDTQVQRMLGTEFGGMNEVLVDLYADTGNERWLELAQRFEHEAFVEPLRRHVDVLPGKHGNTQVPKLIGSADRFAYTGRGADLLAAAFFWERVALHHSYATGGHGLGEYFGEPDRLTDRVDGRTCETCNVYNMLKLTRRLFSIDPDPRYADFHERALFNHILASLEPIAGWACYMVPIGRRVTREYERNMLDGGFTCCTGTSLESHALHGDGLFHESGDTLYVNLYAPSTAFWEDAGVIVDVETVFPEGDWARVSLTLEHAGELTLALRRPWWCADEFHVELGGEELPLEEPKTPGISDYVEIRRHWTSREHVTVKLPKALRLEPLPDDPRRVAILWGPLVLAADLGPERRERTEGDEPIPVLVAAGRPVAEWLRPVEGEPGHFRTQGVGRPRDVDFHPFYRLHRRVYGIYQDLFTPEEWASAEEGRAAEEERKRELEAVTIAHLQPGEMQPERDFHFEGAEDSRPIRTEGRAGRMAKSWFRFTLPVEPAALNALVVTYCSFEHRRQTARFEIRIDGRLLAEEEVPRAEPLRFYDVTYPLPAVHLEGRQRVTVEFRAAEGSSVAGVYGLRTIRSGNR